MDEIVDSCVDGHVAYVVLVGEHKPRFDFIFTLAGVFIVLTFVELIVAFAVVTSRSV